MQADLKDKLATFRKLGLPGQPRFMHMGTAHLVRELEVEIERLEAQHQLVQSHLETPPPPCSEQLGTGLVRNWRDLHARGWNDSKATLAALLAEGE